MALDETLVDLAVDRKVTTLDLAALLYAVNGNPPTLDAVIEAEDFINQIIGVIGTRMYHVLLFDYVADLVAGDGAGYMHIPSFFNGWNLTYVRARVITAGTTNSTTIQLANVTQGWDILSTKLTIASGATLDDGNRVIDLTKDHVTTDDLLRWDVDTIHTTPAKGLIGIAGFTKP